MSILLSISLRKFGPAKHLQEVDLRIPPLRLRLPISLPMLALVILSMLPPKRELSQSLRRLATEWSPIQEAVTSAEGIRGGEGSSSGRRLKEIDYQEDLDLEDDDPIHNEDNAIHGGTAYQNALPERAFAKFSECLEDLKRLGDDVYKFTKKKLSSFRLDPEEEQHCRSLKTHEATAGDEEGWIKLALDQPRASLTGQDMIRDVAIEIIIRFQEVFQQNGHWKVTYVKGQWHTDEYTKARYQGRSLCHQTRANYAIAARINGFTNPWSAQLDIGMRILRQLQKIAGENEDQVIERAATYFKILVEEVGKAKDPGRRTYAVNKGTTNNETKLLHCLSEIVFAYEANLRVERSRKFQGVQKRHGVEKARQQTDRKFLSLLFPEYTYSAFGNRNRAVARKLLHQNW
ncbi:hypothetical protein DL768_010628 [Monosporascus sp. mg162]|nr:hypothetical protein DL768_010628 [Monosporascus sp. mg162]